MSNTTVKDPAAKVLPSGGGNAKDEVDPENRHRQSKHTWMTALNCCHTCRHRTTSILFTS